MHRRRKKEMRKRLILQACNARVENKVSECLLKALAKENVIEMLNKENLGNFVVETLNKENLGNFVVETLDKNSVKIILPTIINNFTVEAEFG